MRLEEARRLCNDEKRLETNERNEKDGRNRDRDEEVRTENIRIRFHYSFSSAPNFM